MLLYIIHVLNSFTLTKRLCGDSLGPCSRFLQSSSHCRCRHSNHQIYTLHRSKPNRLWPFTHIWSYCRIISWNWFNGTCFLPHTWYWTFNTVFRALSGFLMFFHDFWWFSFHGRSRLEMVVHAAFTVFHASFTVPWYLRISWTHRGSALSRSLKSITGSECEKRIKLHPIDINWSYMLISALVDVYRSKPPLNWGTNRPALASTSRYAFRLYLLKGFLRGISGTVLFESKSSRSEQHVCISFITHMTYIV